MSHTHKCVSATIVFNYYVYWKLKKNVSERKSLKFGTQAIKCNDVFLFYVILFQPIWNQGIRKLQKFRKKLACSQSVMLKMHAVSFTR